MRCGPESPDAISLASLKPTEAAYSHAPGPLSRTIPSGLACHPLETAMMVSLIAGKSMVRDYGLGWVDGAGRGAKSTRETRQLPSSPRKHSNRIVASPRDPAAVA